MRLLISISLLMLMLLLPQLTLPPRSSEKDAVTVASPGGVPAWELLTETFGLQISNAVEDLPNTDFYIPGSILRLELESTSPLARGLDAEAAAWYWRSSRAFDVSDVRARVAARYGTGDPLLSGWVLGGEHVAGKPAIVEADIGEGSVVLFGFQPNYRAQTVATWPLLFNAFVR